MQILITCNVCLKMLKYRNQNLHNYETKRLQISLFFDNILNLCYNSFQVEVLRGDDMISKNSLLEVKKHMEGCIGQEIYVKANLGRNKQIEKVGVIDGVFPNLFVIKEQETDHKLSYTYADILTNSLELTKLDTGEPVINYDIDLPKKYTRL